jgi:hypothetical protein
MKIFVFERIEQVSGNYHSEGGLVIIARDIDHAKEVISVDPEVRPTDLEWESVESFELIGNPEPKFWVMPDAGCC